MIEELREATNKANDEAKAKVKSTNEDFFNGDLFKTILFDFEKDAMDIAKRGGNSAPISNLKERFGVYCDLGYLYRVLVYAMEKSGYRHSPSIDSYFRFTWREE